MSREEREYPVMTEKDLADLVENWGFLPLLKNKIPGFSVEEQTLPELWFADGVDGPWEWKGPVIRETGCAYGKFFRGKAGFVSREWYPDFANYRRDGYDFDARYEDGLAGRQDKLVYDVLAEYGSLISKEWRKLAGIRNRGTFDAAVTRLQMQGYVTTVDFEYARDRNGREYGWGLARYALPERYWGRAFTEKVYVRTPGESGGRMLSHLHSLLPGTEEKELRRILG